MGGEGWGIGVGVNVIWWLNDVFILVLVSGCVLGSVV